MIDPHWSLIDLDPLTWRHLGSFLEPQQYIAAAQPGEHGLFVLHDQGRLLKVVDTQTGHSPANIPAQISNPEALAQELYRQGQWDRVHIIDRHHLAWVARQAQATPRRDLTFDEYYHLIYTLLWGKGEGYICEPPPPGNWHGWTYTGIRRFFAALSSPAALALGVYSDDALWIGLILRCEQGQIRQVTTFEGLNWRVSTSGPTQQTLVALCEALDAQFAPPAAVLLCTDSVFSGWLTAPNKQDYLESARLNGTAIWHVLPVK